MVGNLQPIVASRQQLIRVVASDTMQPMVVLTKQQCRDEFSDRLNEAFEKIAFAPEKGRPRWVSRHYKEEISYESARKWLQKESIPDIGHVSMICTDLGIHPTWLLTGHGPMRISDEVEKKTDHRNVVPINQPWPFLPAVSRKQYDDLPDLDKGEIIGLMKIKVREFALLKPKQGKKK
jgi:hypothetical protein